jgi:hypothetical protein
MYILFIVMLMSAWKSWWRETDKISEMTNVMSRATVCKKQHKGADGVRGRVGSMLMWSYKQED